MSETNLLDAFIGSWQLVQMTVFHADGSATHPLGDGAIGQILYSADGFMSCHLMEANRPSLPGYGLDQLSDAELGRSIRAYSGYFGSFSVNAAEGTVTHHIAGAWYPNMIGTDQVRRYKFVGDRLILEAALNEDLVRLEWRRSDKGRLPPATGASLSDE